MAERHRPVRDKIIEIARSRGLITYGEIGAVANAHPRSRTLANILDEINEDEHAARRPLLCAVVVRKDTRKAGPGFYKSATALGRTNPDAAFWAEELEAVYRHWNSPTA